MPHTLAWEDKGVYWKYYGHVSGDEVVEASASIYGDPRFDNLHYKLVDFTDVEILDMSAEQILKIASQHDAARLSNPKIKNALISNTNTEQALIQFRDFFNERESWEVQIFENIKEANDWIGRQT